MDPINQFVTNDAPSCAADASSWCAQVWRVTHVNWIAQSADWLVAKPLKILLIIAIALAVRWLTHHMIDRVTQNRGAKGRKARRNGNGSGTGAVNGNGSNGNGHANGNGHGAAGLVQAWVPLMSERRVQRARTIGSVLKSSVSAVVLSVALIMTLGELGLNLAPIIASAGIVGVAVGFGAQNLVKDFISGVFMLLEDQYGVGDVVDVGPATGTVESVGLRITTLRDISGTVWYVRNGTIARVGNSSQDHAVAVVDVPLAHSANLTQALDLMDSVATAACGEVPLSEDVMAAPAVLGVQKVAPEALTLRLTVKVRPGRQWATQRELQRRIMIAFDEAGIEPPVPAA